MLRRALLILVGVACGTALLGSPAAFAGYTFGPGVGHGSVVPVFNWGDETQTPPFQDACDRTHIPDQPARAFRDNLNRIQLNISMGEVPRPRLDGSVRYQGNRRMIGDTLGTLMTEQGYLATHPGSDARPCPNNVTHTNPYMPPTTPIPGAPKTAAPYPPPPEYDPTKPGNYHDREWLNSMWSGDDGLTVYGFFHNNYQGWRDLNADGVANDDCSQTTLTDQTNKCWYAAITTAKSTNGGATFGTGSTNWLHHYPTFYTGPPGHLVASTPYQYVKDGGRQGLPDLFTNLIRKVPSDGNYYMVFSVNEDGPIQSDDAGICVMRTVAIDMPSSWRAWDGSGYNVQFANPYTSTDPPGDHLCAPISTTTLADFKPEALAFSRYYNKYMLIGMANFGQPDGGVYFSLSTNLIDWEQPRLLMQGSGPSCTDPSTVWYPSVIDEDDPAATHTQFGERNFYQPDRTAYLYFVRNNSAPPPCAKDTFNADLVRVSIEFPAP